jgi:hypothetical protein
LRGGGSVVHARCEMTSGTQAAVIEKKLGSAGFARERDWSGGPDVQGGVHIAATHGTEQW